VSRDPFGHRAEQRVLEPGPPVGSDDDQIHAFFWLVNVMETGDRAVAEAGAAIRAAMAAASA